MAKENLGKILSLSTVILELLKPNEGKQKRKNVRLATRLFKKLKKQWGKDGIDEEEQKMLNDIKKSITEQTINLGK